MSGRKTVLIVDDDPGTLYVLANGLSTVLAMFDVITAENGREAIDALEARQVDVLVTDLAMPVMDGFSLIAYVTNQRSTMPVVVLSGMAPHTMNQRLAGYGGLRVLRKPAGYQEVAQTVLEEIERVDMGQVEGIPLASVLQLIEAERRSCSVVVTSGKRRGRLQFESGRLVNAFSDDFGAEGEAAAYDILSWNDTAIAFEHLPNHLRKLIHTPMQLMLIELAVLQDSVRSHPGGGAADDAPPARAGDEAEPAAEGDDLAGPEGAPAGRAPAERASDDDASEAVFLADGTPDDEAPEALFLADDATDDGVPEAVFLPDDAPDDHAGTGPGPAESPAPLTPAGPATDAPVADGDAAPAPPARTHLGVGFESIAAPERGSDPAAGDGPRLPPHARIVAAGGPTPSHLDTHAAGGHAAAAGVAEATTHALKGDGEAMRPDPTHDEPMPTDPAPAPQDPAMATSPAPVVTTSSDGDREAAQERVPVAAASTGSTPAADAARAAALGSANDHVTDMVAAVERLARRAREADEALAAVAIEVDAFRAAQRRFDEANARREMRRRELEAFRDDVARLAREILGRVDGMFDAMVDAVPGTSERNRT